MPESYAMALRIPAPLLNGISAPVLAQVRDLSAHSDIAESLQAAVEQLGELQGFCPDARAYR